MEDNTEQCNEEQDDTEQYQEGYNASEQDDWNNQDNVQE